MADSMELDGLYCAFDDVLMGSATDRYNARYGVTREEQDAFAAASHRKAAAAVSAGLLAEEIVPVSVPRRKGDPVLFAHDETVRPDTSVEALGKLRPSFGSSGTITAGTSSPLSDGAAAVVVCSRRKAEELGLSWIAEIGAHGTVAGPDPSLHEQPSNAVRAALAKAGLSVSDLDLVEINEAFASVGVVSTAKLGVPEDIVNTEGGAIALGHPLGASGTRLVLHLSHALRRRGAAPASRPCAAAEARAAPSSSTHRPLTDHRPGPARPGSATGAGPGRAFRARGSARTPLAVGAVAAFALALALAATVPVR